MMFSLLASVGGIAAAKALPAKTDTAPNVFHYLGKGAVAVTE